MSRRKLLVTISVILLLVLVLANWQTTMFAVAALTAESVPALLDDAQWDKPESAHKFMSRFNPGSPESALVSWLHAKDFTVDEADGTAFREISGLPCLLHIQVKWTRTSLGTLGSATATVSEAGCL